MANRYVDPVPAYWSSTAAYAGGKLNFYLTGTSTRADTFSLSTLDPGSVNSNPVILDSAGQIPPIFLTPTVTYKVTLTDSNDNLIWTRDPVVDPAANVTAAFAVYTGNPNGAVAGTQGTLGGSSASVIWDITNNLLYVCTTTGTTGWTQVAAQLGGAINFTGLISPTSLAAQADDYAPTSFGSAYHVRQDSTVDVTITGWAGGTAGREFVYTNISNFKHTFSVTSTGSVTVTNRFIGSYDLVVMPGESFTFWYDPTSARWRWEDVYPMGFAEPGGRLTITTATPVIQADTVNQGTIYYTPHKHSYLRLFNGGWYTVKFAEISQLLTDTTKSPAATVASSCYDLFVWNDAGTIRLSRGPVWTSSAAGTSARGAGAATTELVLVDGVYLNAQAITNGPAAQRGLYVGSIWTDASNKLNMQFFPAAAAGGPTAGCHLNVWNMYNRVNIAATERDSSDTWTYTTATIRQANAAAGGGIDNRFYVMNGLIEDAVSVTCIQASSNASNCLRVSGIGINSTTVFSGTPAAQSTETTFSTVTSAYMGLLALGANYIAKLEYSAATGTSTWYGDNGVPTLQQNGMQMIWRM